MNYPPPAFCKLKYFCIYLIYLFLSLLFFSFFVDIFSFMYEMLFDFCAAFCDNLCFNFIPCLYKLNNSMFMLSKKNCNEIRF